jgi:hypothetical protein
MTSRNALLAVWAVALCGGAASGQFPKEKPVITSVEPLSGKEGTIVTIKGRNFPTNHKNSCIVVGGMGAMATVEPRPTATEIRVKIGPVAKKSVGDVLMWPGTALDLHTSDLSTRDTALTFTRTRLFRNGSPVTAAGVKFELTDVSPDTYAGYFQEKPTARVELDGLERGGVVRTVFPRDLKVEKGAIADVVFMLKEPTLAIGFTAEISGRQGSEDVLRVIAKGVVASAMAIGETVAADVARNDKTGEWELYVAKPLLVSGKGTVRFRGKDSKIEGANW